VHAEISPDEFRRQGGALEILQLWVNLPARLKMTPPRYTGLQRDAIARVSTPDGGGVVNLIAGRYGDREGPIHSLTGVFMSTVELSAGARAAFADLAGRSIFLYVVRGRVRVGGRPVPAFTLAEVDDGGDRIELVADEPSVVLFGHADPIGEPVVAHGPFVMNTRDEIVAAMRDYQAGRFDALPQTP
jgi:redox-sensitive bicupin YhaK (pirin superfamily)